MSTSILTTTPWGVDCSLQRVLHEAGKKHAEHIPEERSRRGGEEVKEEETERWSGWRWQKMDSTQGQVGV